MLYKIIQKVYDFGVNNTPKILPYISSLFYLEIMYLSFILFLISGRSVAIVFVLILTIIYSLQIINLSKKNNIARKIQILIFDVHIASGIVFFICTIFMPNMFTGYSVWYFLFKIVSVLVEMPLLYFLTLDDVVRQYNMRSESGQST
jgi:hypothetical protein